MSEELTRKMAKAYYAKSEDCSYDATAMRAVLRTVLEHYSEPGSISDDLSAAFNLAYTSYWDKHWQGESHPKIGREADKRGIATAMRQALKEMESE